MAGYMGAGQTFDDTIGEFRLNGLGGERDE